MLFKARTERGDDVSVAAATVGVEDGSTRGRRRLVAPVWSPWRVLIANAALLWLIYTGADRTGKVVTLFGRTVRRRRGTDICVQQSVRHVARSGECSGAGTREDGKSLARETVTATIIRVVDWAQGVCKVE